MPTLSRIDSILQSKATGSAYEVTPQSRLERLIMDLPTGGGASGEDISKMKQDIQSNATALESVQSEVDTLSSTTNAVVSAQIEISDNLVQANADINSLETTASLHRGELNALDSRLDLAETNITGLNTANSNLSNSLTATSSTVSDLVSGYNTVSGKITALETSETQQGTKITALETSDTQQNAKLTTLENAKDSHGNRLTALETHALVDSTYTSPST